MGRWQQIKIGKELFDECHVRNVETHNKSGLYSGKLVCPKAAESTTNVNVGHDYPNRHGAYRAVRSRAAEFLCTGCEYSGLSTLDVSEIRRENAEAELERVRAEIEVATAQQELQQLRTHHPIIPPDR